MDARRVTWLLQGYMATMNNRFKYGGRQGARTSAQADTGYHLCVLFHLGRLLIRSSLMGRRLQLWGPGALKMLALLFPEEKRAPQKTGRFGWLQNCSETYPKYAQGPWMVLSCYGLDLRGVGEATSHLQVIEESQNQ